MDERIESVEAKSLAATENILKTAVATERVASRVCETVKSQGEHLQRIQRQTGTIAEDLTIAEQDISELERLCCCWLPLRNPSRKRRWWDEHKGRHHQVASADKFTAAQAVATGRTEHEKSMINTVTGSENEQQIDRNLRGTSYIVANIKVLAVELGQELDEQNRTLDSMNSETEQVIQQLKDETKRLSRL